MLIKIITLRFSVALDSFDDSPLTDFIRDKSVVSLRDYFFLRNETPYLTVLVVYDPVLETMHAPSAKNKKQKRDESWRALLKDDEMQLFDSLRSWRAEQCKKDGVPPYVICNNKQLAQMVSKRPQTLAELGRIEGIGQAKLEKYGRSFLELLKVDKGETATEKQ